MLGIDIWGAPSERAAADFYAFSTLYDEQFFEGLAEPRCIEGGEVAREIIARRDARVPSSFVRISDGEGNLVPLSFDISVGSNLLDYCLERISYIHFGSGDVILENREFFGQVIKDAIGSADLVGFPKIGTVLKSFETEDRKKDVRAIVGNRSAFMLRPGFEVVSDAWLSRGLLPHYPEILRGEARIGLISVYPELAEKLQSTLEIDSVRFIKVPTQAALQSVSERKNSGHYPDEMERIISEIVVDFPGMIFLVAAGLLGKKYATEIKSRGGIAIDIGSIAEVWMGIEARGLSSDYIDKWRL